MTVAVLAAFLALTAILFLPLVRHMSSAVVNAPADASSTARDYWAADAQGRTVFTLHRDRLLYAPEGLDRSTAVQVANAAQPAFVLGTHRLLGVGYLGALNFYMLLGFVLTGLATFLLLRRITLSTGAALFGAVVFSFNWWAYEPVYYGHNGFTQLWIFPLLLLELLVLRDELSWKLTVATGLTLCLSFYLSSYFGLIAGALLASFVLVDSWSRERLLREAITRYAVVVIVALIGLLPAGLAPLLQPHDGLGLPSMSLSDLRGANLLNFVLPSAHDPIFGSLVRHWRPQQTGENVLFLGFATIAVAVAAIVLRRRRHLCRTSQQVLAFRTSIVLVISGLLLSLPAAATIRSVAVPLPTPARAIGGVVSWWRVYERFGILAVFGVAILSALAFDALLRSRRRWAVPAALACVVLTAAELIPGAPVRVAKLDRPTPATQWLAEHPGGTVALYPMALGWQLHGDVRAWDDYSWGSIYAQVQHRHPLYAPPTIDMAPDRRTDVRVATLDLDAPLTPALLASERVRYVVVDSTPYRNTTTQVPRARAGLRLLHRVGDVRIYAVTAKPVDLDTTIRSQAAHISLVENVIPPPIGFGEGFLSQELYNGGPARWMEQDGVLRLGHGVRAATMRYALRLRTLSAHVRRRVEVVDGAGQVLGRAVVGTGDETHDIGNFTLPSRPAALRLHVTPGPAPLGAGDQRTTSIYVIEVGLVPLGH